MAGRRVLAGKRAVVAGASSGIGRAVAFTLAKRGALVIAVARSDQKLIALHNDAAAAGCEITPHVADLTVADDRNRLMDVVRSSWGRLDLLVNAAGVGAFGHFIDLDPGILRRVFEVNFFALAETCRAAVPLLALGDDPAIANISSMTGRRAVPAWTDYSASKFAVCGFTEGLRAELVRFGVEVLLVVPGLTQSDLGRNLLADRGRRPANFAGGLPAEVVAEAIVRGLENRRREIWIERKARLLLWLNWLCPAFIDWKLRGVVRDLYAEEITARKISKTALSDETQRRE